MWASAAETVHISVVLPADRLQLGVEANDWIQFPPPISKGPLRLFGRLDAAGASSAIVYTLPQAE